MARGYLRLWRELFGVSRRRGGGGGRRLKQEPDGAGVPAGKTPIRPQPAENLHWLKDHAGESSDLVTREMDFRGQPFALAYFDGLIDKEILQEEVLRALMLDIQGTALQADPSWTQNYSRLLRVALPVSEVKEVATLEEAAHELLHGGTALFGPGWPRALALSTRGWEKRDISEPDTEAIVRGPREGFTENLRTNTSLVRRRLRTSELVFESLHLGRLSHTEVAVAYLRNLVDHQLLAEVHARLNRIAIDSIQESAYIEELIEDHPFSPFPQMVASERPDRVVVALLQGKVAIFCDGTPFVLMCPCSFITFLQSPEDYYNRWLVTIGIRFFRLLGVFFATFLPAIYVALTTFHQELIPTPLAVAMASQREGVPYPAVVEALFMQVVFEILTEAGVRLPKQMGQAIGIVGALVIGEAAVRAGFASSTMVIVIAMTAIASFTIPNYALHLAVRMLRLPMIALAAGLGLFGIFSGMLAILIHLVTLRSFGEPYLSPFAPMVWEDLKDTIGRVPWWAMLTRSKLTAQRNFWRQRPGGKRILPAQKRGPEQELEARLRSPQAPRAPRGGKGKK